MAADNNNPADVFSKRHYYEEGTELIVCRWFAVAQRLHAAQVGPDPIT